MSMFRSSTTGPPDWLIAVLLALFSAIIFLWVGYWR